MQHDQGLKLSSWYGSSHQWRDSALPSQDPRVVNALLICPDHVDHNTDGRH